VVGLRGRRVAEQIVTNTAREKWISVTLQRRTRIFLAHDPFKTGNREGGFRVSNCRFNGEYDLRAMASYLEVKSNVKRSRSKNRVKNMP